VGVRRQRGAEGECKGSLDRLSSIREPLLDAELRDYARMYWDTSTWQNGALIYPWVHLEQPVAHLGNGAEAYSTRVPFASGHTLMAYIYWHRLVDTSGRTVMGLDDLLLQDREVRQTWKHWTKYQQLITDTTRDATAHANHQLLVSFALSGDPALELRGLPVQTAERVVSDRMYILDETAVQAWFESAGIVTMTQGPGGGIVYSAGGAGNQGDSGDATGTHSEPGPCDELQDWIDDVKDDLSAQPGGPASEEQDSTPPQDRLYKADGPPDPNTGEAGETGFDCDDFATALGNKVKHSAPANIDQGELEVRSGRVKYKKDGKTVAHRVVHVDYKDCFWLIDPQTGNATGPFPNGAPRDAGPLLEGSYGDPGTEFKTAQGPKALDWRPSSEPPAFQEDPEASQHFRDHVGEGADAFFPPAD
jgi:hypothetical protein